MAFGEELEILRATGANPADRAVALTRLGATHTSAKDYVSAERVLLEAKKINESTVRDPLAYVDTLQALATLYIATDRTALARETAQFALRYTTTGSEEDDRRVWGLEMILAETYRYEGNLPASIPHFTAASVAANRHQSAFALKNFDTFERMSKTYFELRRPQDAVSIRELSLGIWKRVRGSAAPNVAPIRELAAWYRALGRPDEAKRVFPRFGIVVRSRIAGDEQARDGEPEPRIDAPLRDMKAPARAEKKAEPSGNIANAAKVVAGLREGFRSCYQRTLDGDPSLQGSVSLHLRVAADGSVAAAVGYSLELPAETIDCMLEHAMVAVFESPEGGAAVVNVPVNLLKQ